MYGQSGTFWSVVAMGVSQSLSEGVTLALSKYSTVDRNTLRAAVGSDCTLCMLGPFEKEQACGAFHRENDRFVKDHQPLGGKILACLVHYITFARLY